MSYYKILGLDKEPFSTSPDPKFFYESNEHKSALYRLRVAIELRRGLSVILGDVGTGKTTLSRRLSQLFGLDPSLIVTMILNPVYESELQFLRDLAERFHIKIAPHPDGEKTVLDYLKAIEKFLFEKGVEDNKTIIILVDESQKLNLPCLEALRSLLNYETNDTKLLQLVLFGQLELHSKIIRIPNFMDRISFKYTLNPLSLSETREMIQFRIKQANYCSQARLFQDDAIEMIHRISQGYPRKITMLCHRALKQLVMRQKWAVDEEIVGEIISEDMRAGWLIQTHH